MPKTATSRSNRTVIPMLAKESLYVGIDVGKHRHLSPVHS
jgi:hypothetical protein